jgi:monoterpene epsilon-lactone hydrolase
MFLKIQISEIKMPSFEMQKFSRLIRENQPQGPQTVAERRQRMEEQQARLRLPEDLREQHFSINGCAARWIETADVRSDRVVLYLHGGAYMMGSVNTHRELMARIARAGACRVLAIDYRLAPEHPFPAALDDALAAYHWLLAQDMPPTQLMIAGDSAGGGLALSTLLALRDANAPLPAGAILLSPWTDLTASGASIMSRAVAEPMLDIAMLREAAMHYSVGNDAKHPLISPHFGDFRALPPLLIQVGDAEILLDDSSRLAAAATAAGVNVEFDICEDAFHVYHMFPQLPESTTALAAIGNFFQKYVAD